MIKTAPSIQSKQQQAADHLRSFLDRIERLEEDRKTLADDIADVYRELDAAGYDKVAAKVIVKIRRDAEGLAKWTERSSTVDAYLAALGMLPEDEARAPARAREIIEEFPSQDRLKAPVQRQPEPAESRGDEISAPTPDFVPAFLRETKPLRPHCLRPELCASGTRDHCHSCKKAADLHEAAA